MLLSKEKAEMVWLSVHPIPSLEFIGFCFQGRGAEVPRMYWAAVIAFIGKSFFRNVGS